MAKLRQLVTAGTIVVGLLTTIGTARAASGVVVALARRQLDPITGLRWQWIPDAQHPEAPPRLALVRSANGPAAEGLPKTMRCVRAGDALQLQSVGNGSVSIEVTALAAGGQGDRIPARVRITGARIQITILGPGAGMLEPGNEAWR